MAMKFEQLYSKHVSVDNKSVDAGASAVRPFKIGVTDNTILKIWGLVVCPGGIVSDVTAEIQASLIQKDETEADNVSTGPLGADLEANIRDNDLMMQMVWFIASAAGGDNIERRQDLSMKTIMLPKPMLIPRSPTLVLHSHDTQITMANLTASIFYEKVEVTPAFKMKLFKQYVGRKQDVVSNIQPVQEA